MKKQKIYRALFRLVLHLNVKSVELNTSYIVVAKDEVFDQLQVIGDELVIANAKNGEYLSVALLRFGEILNILDEVSRLIVEVYVARPTLYNPLNKR